MAKHHMYDNTPEIRHAEEGGTKVVKPTGKEKSDGQTDEGVKAEHFPIHVRHAHERHSMHTKHEMEHGIHDASKAGHKGELHKRHEKESHEMHSRHEHEAGETAGSHDQGAPIKDIEKGAKA